MQKLVMATAAGEEHGLVNTLTNAVRFDDFKNMTPADKAKCEKEKKEDARMVKVKYINMRGSHERLTKPYCRWAGDPILCYHLIPNYQYDVPMGFVNEVNNMTVVKRSGLVSEDGNPVNKDESPMDRDKKGDQIHMLVPINF